MDGEQRFYECIGLIWQKLNITYGARCLILGFAGFQGDPRMRGDDVSSKEHDLRTLKYTKSAIYRTISHRNYSRLNRVVGSINATRTKQRR
jgi:hypothetical protein